jgi:hypothetical protein
MLEIITTRAQLIELAQRLGVRHDWHEPDEQGLTAKVEGRSFDNAGFWPRELSAHMPASSIEKHVILSKDGQPVAAVNLATLFAWACGTCD